MPKQAYFNLPEEKKERVRNAVVDLFGTLPYEEVTTRLLVKEAGISMGSMYQYFDSKDEMYIYFIDELYTEFSNKGIAQDVLLGKYAEYLAEKHFIDSMFFAPAAVLEQYYFSNQTNTYKLNLQMMKNKMETGAVPEDLDAGLFQFLAGGFSLSMIMYSRTMNIQTAEGHRRFWNESSDTIIHFMRDMAKTYEDGLILTGDSDTNIFSINK